MKVNQNIEVIETKYRKIISLKPEYSDYEEKVNSLMNNFDLLIPAYQRPYSWTKKNIEQLLSDLLHQVIYFPNEDYFLGMIFTLERQTTSDYKMYEIVDGQQRLTTILLLLTYFKLSFNDKKHTYFIREINQINLSSESDKDKKILSKIIECKSLEELFKMLNEEQKQAKLFSDLFYSQQIGIFKSALKTMKKFLEKNDVVDYSEKIYQYIFNKVKVLHIISRPDDLIGDQFFSSLNGKGLKLDQVDLLKSSFIHPYVTTKEGIKNFKDKWASLIKNTKNDMLNEIGNYFASYTKNKNKITPSKLNDYVNKTWPNDKNIKNEFEKMCSFFDKYASFLDANTKDPVINFYVKLNQRFNFDKYKKVVFTAIMNTPNFSMDNSKDLAVIAKILESLFKINFIYLTVLGCTANEFIGDVINKYIKSEEITDANKISELLANQLDEILNYTDINIGEKFKNYKFNYDLLHYDSPKTNSYKIIFLLNLISETYNNDLKNIEYNKASNMIKYHIDHRVQKAEKKSLFYNEDNKKTIPWKTEIKDHKKRVKFLNSYFDVFKDEEFNTKYCIKRDNMTFETFVNMLNQPFNLKLLDGNDNKHKSSRSWLTKNELSEHFTISNENTIKDKLMKSWNWILYSKYELLLDNINSSSYINTWRILEQILKNRLQEQGLSKQDMESMRKEQGFLSKLINLSFDKGIIRNKDDFNLCKHILANRNKAQHDGASDKLNPDYETLIKKLLEKISRE